MSDKPLAWPPDIFALTGAILEHTGGYRCVADDAFWPSPAKDHARRMEDMGRKWRLAVARGADPPDSIRTEWKRLKEFFPKTVPRALEFAGFQTALLNLLGAADEASRGVGFPFAADAYHRRALDLLLRPSIPATLCQAIPPSFVSVLPKVHTPQVGLTFRSLSHHLALWRACEVEPAWYGIPSAAMFGQDGDPNELNLLVIPFPYEISPNAFSPNRDHTRCGRSNLPPEFGFFAYTPPCPDTFLNNELPRLLDTASAHCRIHGVVLPESSLTPNSFEKAMGIVLSALPNAFLLAGVVEVAGSQDFARNTARYVVPLDAEHAAAFQQQKHHRWRLDGSQIERYGLMGRPDRDCYWWESAEIGSRGLNFFVVRHWLTCCFLICEDLARQEPIAPLLRAIGPNLVIALLLDGPQLDRRWPARYATVLAEDPGSSVLTVTSLGMCRLSRNGGRGGSVAALWRDKRISRELSLPKGAQGLILHLHGQRSAEFSADGCSNRAVNDIYLDPVDGVIPLRLKSRVRK